nr:MAG: hypothetical protein [Crogonang virus 35]
MRNVDVTVLLNYYRGRVIKGNLQVNDFHSLVDMPFDGYTGLPSLIVDGQEATNWSTRFERNIQAVGGPGPTLIPGANSEGFVQILEDYAKMAGTLRTNVSFMQTSTNLMSFLTTRDTGIDNDGTNPVTGSACLRLLRVLIVRDQLSGTTDFCPIWNKVDAGIVFAATTAVPTVLYPKLDAPPQINYWACYQMEYLSFVYERSRINPAIPDPIFVFLTRDSLAFQNRILRTYKTIAKLPIGIVANLKRCTMRSHNNLTNEQTFFTFLDGVTERRNFSTLLPTTAVRRGYDIIFVLTDSNATVNQQQYGYQYRVDLAGGLGVDSDINNPFSNAGIPYINGSDDLLQGLVDISQVRSETEFDMFLTEWWDVLGNDDDYRRALVAFTFLKYGFIDAASTTPFSDLVALGSTEGFMCNRSSGTSSKMNGLPINTASFRDVFMPAEDCIGTQLTSLVAISTIQVSNMADKFEFACYTKVRIPDPVYKTRMRPRQLSAPEFAIHGFELACALRQEVDHRRSEMGSSPMMTYGFLEPNFNPGIVGYDIYRELQTMSLKWLVQTMCAGGITRDFLRPTQFSGVGNLRYHNSVRRYMLDTAQKQAPWYKEGYEQKAIRDFSSVISDNMKVKSYILSVRGTSFGPVSLTVNKADVSMDEFSKLWQPNALGLGFYNDGTNMTPRSTSFYLIDDENNVCWNMFVDFTPPDASNWYRSMELWLTAANTAGDGLLSDVRQCQVFETPQLKSYPNYKMKATKIGLPSLGAQYLMNSISFFSQSINSNRTSIQTFPTVMVHTLSEAEKNGISQMENLLAKVMPTKGAKNVTTSQLSIDNGSVGDNPNLTKNI